MMRESLQVSIIIGCRACVAARRRAASVTAAQTRPAVRWTRCVATWREAAARIRSQHAAAMDVVRLTPTAASESRFTEFLERH